MIGVEQYLAESLKGLVKRDSYSGNTSFRLILGFSTISNFNAEKYFILMDILDEF